MILFGKDFAMQLPTKETISFLLKIPVMKTESGRLSLIPLAGLEEIENNIDIVGTTIVFCSLFVKTLVNYRRLESGEYAIVSLLGAVNDYLIGPDRRQSCEQLIEKWRMWFQETSNQDDSQKSEEIEQDLFKSLLKLDFEQQVKQVVQAIDFYPVAAFLVHGEEHCGQGTLLTRLCQLRPSWRSGRYIPLDVGSNSVQGSLDMVWSLLAEEFGQDPTATDFTNQLIEKIFECWQNQTVIFALKKVNIAPVGFLKQLIEKFWQPVVERVGQELGLPDAGRDNQNGHQPHFLIMFLVDNEGYICNSNILPLAWNYKQSEYPRVPFPLQSMNRIPSDKLQLWILMAIEDEVIPEHLTADILLTESKGGIPQLIYKKVCEYCGCSWEGGLAKWLK